MTFTLTIELGNGPIHTHVYGLNLKTSYQVADALRDLAAQMDAPVGANGRFANTDGCGILDANGNSVGQWEVK